MTLPIHYILGADKRGSGRESKTYKDLGFTRHSFHRVYTVTPTNGDSHCNTYLLLCMYGKEPGECSVCLRVCVCVGETGLQLNVNDKINSELLGECRVHGLEKTEYYIELKIKQLTVPWNFQKIFQ